MNDTVDNGDLLYRIRKVHGPKSLGINQSYQSWD